MSCHANSDKKNSDENNTVCRYGPAISITVGQPTWTGWSEHVQSNVVDRRNVYLGAEVLGFGEMIDDDVTLEYDVIDALAGPDELCGSASHKPRLHH